ncbi:MAG: class I SAM-dependent methyltransferase [Dehalococcoidia bacterium]|nr:class I SAM-dependent methyltransferase [Dehalococcoidia bacterium]
MTFTWTEQSIQWFLEASSYTGFHNTLAQKLAPHLSTESTLLDAGCGLGRLDLALAQYVSHLSAVDTDGAVLGIIKRDAELLKIDNIHTRCEDAFKITDSFDIVLTSFFGQNTVELFALCREKFIRVVNASKHSNLYPEYFWRDKKSTVPSIQEQLNSQGISYQLQLETLEFGQPLRSWQDAEQFVLRYAPEASPKEISEFLNQNLVPIKQDNFSFYLPNKKTIGIFIIEKGKN